MNKYKLVIAYDGTDFQGWQSQPNRLTIADCLINTFEKVFNEKIVLIGASRTDTGVHAFGQVASFRSEINIPCDRIKKAWNDLLPESIKIRELEICRADFHPLKNVSEKIYYYNIFTSDPLPFFSRYGWYYDMTNQVDWDKFRQILSLYEGKHDFRSFCRLDEDKDTIRVVDSIVTRKILRLDVLQVVIKGKGFLHFQIRRMIGYALDVARRKDIGIEYIKELLKKPASRQKLLKAPAKGLFLRKIIYNDRVR